MNRLSNEDDDNLLSKMELDDIGEVGNTSDNRGNVTISAVDGFEDDDEEVFFIGSFVKNADSKPNTPCNKVVSKVKVTGGKALFSSPATPAALKNRLEQRESDKVVRRTSSGGDNNVFKKPEGFGFGDDWKSFVRWFERQGSFKTPWFQTIPITGLTDSQCRSVVRGCKDWGHLVQFAKMLVSFLEDVQGACGDDEFTSRGDVTQLIEILFARLERDLMNNDGFKSLSSQQRLELDCIFEDVSQRYVTGKLNLGDCSIPEQLVRLYPKALDDMMSTVAKTGEAELLVPVCANSPANFLKILERLHSNAGVLEDDPDFQQNNTRHPSHKLASNLIESLKQKLGCGYLRILPATLQPIFSFDSVVCKSRDNLSNNKMIIDELYSLLNELFCERARACDSCKRDDFLRFILNLLPFTSRVLSDKELIQNVKYKKYPYLWISVKKLRSFQ